MALTRWFRIFGMVTIALTTTLSLAAQGDMSAIQQKLNAQFKLTRTTADRSDIVEAGDVVTIQKPGMLMYAVFAPLPPSNNYKNGRIGQGWSGFGKDLAISMAAPGGATAADYPHRQFVPQEKCWVTSIQVQQDGVHFQLYSDPYDDIRYYGNLKIPFPNKKQVPSVSEALQLVTEVLAVDSQGERTEAVSEPAREMAPPTPPMAEIPPPPIPVDAVPPPTIALGQTIDHVVANFGQPVSKTKVGVKVIYKYPDMKVTFTNGKVTDVE